MLRPLIVGLLFAATAPRAVTSSPTRPPAKGKAAAGEQAAATGGGCTAVATSAATVARGAKLVCGSVAVDAALRTVLLRPEESEHATRTLITLGLRTALDLQLLGPEVDELMDELKASGLSLGDRAKVRLLIGDPEPAHLPPPSTPEARDARTSQDSHHPPLRRAMQDAPASTGGLSTDTIAIVLTVLVGAVGYFVQAYTARRAEQAQVEQAQEHHLTELKRQREHEQMLAQIQRTDRWLDDCCRPIMQCMGNYSQLRIRFICAAANMIERSDPETFSRLWGELECPALMVEHPDGRILSPNSKGQFNPNVGGSLHTLTTNSVTEEMTGGAGGGTRMPFLVALLDTLARAGDTLTFAELPRVSGAAHLVSFARADHWHSLSWQGMFEVIANDLDAPLAREYRRYIRSQVLLNFNLSLAAAAPLLSHC